MSIKVMSFVWDGFPATGSELLAMLALADWCDDRGGSLFPSMRAVAEKIRVSEKQARRILRGFEEKGFLVVVGNAHGGAPGTTKQFRLNVAELKSLADIKEQTPPAGVRTVVFSTPPAGVTPTAGVTPPMGVPDPSHGCPITPPTDGSQSPIEPPIEPSSIPAAPSALPPTVPAAPADKPKKPAKAAKPANPDEEALQEACRQTWAAYSEAYEGRYHAAPLRNAPTSAKVKQFVIRVGQTEAPDVARFFVERVAEPFVVRSYHGVGLLLQNAEAYHTQWVTNCVVAPPVSAYQARQEQRAVISAGLANKGNTHDYHPDYPEFHPLYDDNTLDIEARIVI